MRPTTAKNLLLAGAALFVPAAVTGQSTTYPVTQTSLNMNIPKYGWFGLYNDGVFNGVLTVGKNNLLAIGTSADTGSAAIGRGLRVNASNSVAVGQYNNYSLTGSTPRFMVGNGTSDNTADRSTIMDVRHDGAVTLRKVPAKGGISMGAFTGPPIPTPPPA